VLTGRPAVRRATRRRLAAVDRTVIRS